MPPAGPPTTWSSTQEVVSGSTWPAWGERPPTLLESGKEKFMWSPFMAAHMAVEDSLLEAIAPLADVVAKGNRLIVFDF
jgi:hypothetical protein